MTLKHEARRYARAVQETYGNLYDVLPESSHKILGGALNAADSLEIASRSDCRSADLIRPYDNATRAERALLEHLKYVFRREFNK